MKTYYIKWLDKSAGKDRTAVTSANNMDEVRARIKKELGQTLPEDYFKLVLPEEKNPSYMYHETRDV